MGQIKSIFGTYADNLQVMIDSSLAQFAPTWFPNYFPWAPLSPNLTFTTAIGASRIEAAASVIARGSRAPLRGRMPLSKYDGKIPPISEKFALDEEDYRDFIILQNMAVSDQDKENQLLDLMFGDVKKVGNSAMKRLDMFALEAVSTGQITLTMANNPDGVQTPTAVDLLMPSGNKTNAAVDWGTSATATPIDDINLVVRNAKASGVTFAKILMSPVLFAKFAKTKQVIDSLTSYNQLQKGAAIATIAKINDYLQGSLLPQIEIVDQPIGVEKDGVMTTVFPFSDTNAVFIPAGNLGRIANAVAIESLRPVEKVVYATYNKALISKWADNEPFNEFTKVELNAFPSVDAIGAIRLLSTTLAF